MKIFAEEMKIVDAMDYKQMLNIVRFGKSGEKYTRDDELSKYFHMTWMKKAADTHPEARVRASKELGWDVY